MDKPIVKGPVDGNIFAILGAASKALKHIDQHNKVNEMFRRATSTHSYDEALSVIMEYVEFNL